jgi:hypothetical protein
MREGRMFFFEKRTKKLLLLGCGVRPRRRDPAPSARSKSFLVLFFKKEHPFFLPARG